ncbi:MAG: hypothetical protein ABW007_24305 [Chitinophagaceae bacterium]
MFRNRKIQVDVVKEKKAKPAIVENPGPSFEEKAVMIGRLMERSIKKITIAVCAIILVDTIRRVAVEATSQTPEE